MFKVTVSLAFAFKVIILSDLVGLVNSQMSRVGQCCFDPKMSKQFGVGSPKKIMRSYHYQ